MGRFIGVGDPPLPAREADIRVLGGFISDGEPPLPAREASVAAAGAPELGRFIGVGEPPLPDREGGTRVFEATPFLTEADGGSRAPLSKERTGLVGAPGLLAAKLTKEGCTSKPMKAMFLIQFELRIALFLPPITWTS